MGDTYEENMRKRKVMVIAAAHATTTTAVAAACLFLNIPREPWLDRSDERKKYMASLLIDDDSSIANLRMGVVPFKRLCALIKAQGTVEDNHNCEVEEMVMRFLHLLSHNVKHRVLEKRFCRSRETISRQFNLILDCVIQLYKPLIADHLQAVHGSGTSSRIRTDPQFAHYFKDCLGALDGTHIHATIPIEEQDRFRGRKHRPTQNVLAACCFDLKFTYVLAGWEGTAHDQKVLDDALVRSNPFVVPQGKTKHRGVLYLCIYLMIVISEKYC
ncbi:hypothetical protein ACHQM5_013910 [Ranunculus cassubicifolius]